jgi:hypothetical protein
MSWEPNIQQMRLRQQSPKDPGHLIKQNAFSPFPSIPKVLKVPTLFTRVNSKSLLRLKANYEPLLKKQKTYVLLKYSSTKETFLFQKEGIEEW